MIFQRREVKLQTRPDERMNVTHSLEPARVAAEARPRIAINDNSY